MGVVTIICIVAWATLLTYEWAYTRRLKKAYEDVEALIEDIKNRELEFRKVIDDYKKDGYKGRYTEGV